ncbi:phospholipase A [Chitinibacter sp. SCUT-21]|uniref:phospholipase A n=1 Tax=Chitinibacter sp. SCUT-21 TaxID=2970891 RepID=UPI0035A612D2
MKPLLYSLAFFATATQAADLAQCQTIAEDSARLACYDHLAASATPAAPAVEIVAEQSSVQPLSVAAPADVIAQAEPALVYQAETMALRWELDADAQDGVFNIKPYQPVYILPFSIREHVNRSPCSSVMRTCAQNVGDGYKKYEAKFQLSFKTKFWQDILGSDIDLWGAYTQQSYWQVYDVENSAPFRTTDYKPEMWATIPVDLGPDWLKLRMINLGFAHQSNGQSDPLSRSWNRLYASVGLTSGDASIIVKPWWRVTEKPEKDDNPDMEDYAGRMETLISVPWQDHVFALTWRNNLRFNSSVPNRSSWQLEWAFPLLGRLHGYVQAFDGYGDSMHDYNFKNRGVALGVSLVNWH